MSSVLGGLGYAASSPASSATSASDTDNLPSLPAAASSRSITNESAPINHHHHHHHNLTINPTTTTSTASSTFRSVVAPSPSKGGNNNNSNMMPSPARVPHTPSHYIPPSAMTPTKFSSGIVQSKSSPRSEHSSRSSSPDSFDKDVSTPPASPSHRQQADGYSIPPPMVAYRIDDDEDVTCIEVFEEPTSISPSSAYGMALNTPSPLCHWYAWFCPEDKEFIVNAPARIFESNKNGLVSLMEIAEELGCGAVWMAVDSTRADFAAIVSALGFLGFRATPKTAGSDSTILLRYDIQ